MAEKQLDAYWILGIIISFLGIAINYIFPEEIPLIWLIIGLSMFSGLVAFIIQVSFVLSKFSDIDSRLKKFKGKIENLEAEMLSLKQTFKTEKELSKLKMDIKEIQMRIFK